MFSEEEIIQLSALQHFVFCQRQCALIHIEQCWIENQWTAEGRVLHERAHEETMQNLKNVRIERSIPLWSDELGLTGKADVVEFHKLPNQKERLVFPVEFKHGKPKQDHCDAVQLCAQALCLEEMMQVVIPKGAIFYGKTRHRLEIEFSPALRTETVAIIGQLRAFLAARKTPLPGYTKKCEACSFINECLPKTLCKDQNVTKYLFNEVCAL